jgi:hypothetical protein
MEPTHRGRSQRASLLQLLQSHGEVAQGTLCALNINFSKQSAGEQAARQSVGMNPSQRPGAVVGDLNPRCSP